MGDSARSEPTTMVPPFDVEEFARDEDAKASHVRLRAPSGELPKDPKARTAALLARLRPLSRVPRLTKTTSELRSLVEDPATAFVLGFIDGILPLAMLVEVTGLPELDVLQVLDSLISDGLVALR